MEITRDGKKLRALRRRWGVRDEAICTIAGVSKGTLQRVYSNAPDLKEETIEAVLMAFEHFLALRTPDAKVRSA